MEFINFSNCKLSNRFYGGSEKKLGIIYKNHNYMLKFQKDSAFGKRNNHISEYLASHIFSLCGLNTHITLLGTYKGENVVACLDFLNEGCQFVPFNDIGESTLDQDKERYQYEYEDIIQMLKDNSKLTNVSETINTFWDIFILDALLGNFDRHGANWGFIKINNRYSLSPVFDNGSSLFSQLTDENEMINIMNSKLETNKRIFIFPTSQIKLNHKKSSYYDVIHSLQFEECNKALVRIYKRIDLNKINTFIDDMDILTDIHKSFYKYIIQKRYEHIIQASYNKLMEIQK